MRSTSLPLVLVVLALVSGCARMPTGATTLKAANPGELRKVLLSGKADVDQFRLRGPFEVAMHTDHELPLSASERIEVDWYLAAPAEKAPLVILLHGQDNSKEDHSYQALHLATWGVHSVAVQLPNRGPWVDNGKTLARIVDAIRRQPELVDQRIDVERIILAGHSLGGAAVVVALAEGAPAAGAILLDPASLRKELPAYLKRVNKPVMLIGADQRYSPVRDPSEYFFHIPRGIAEISITDAHHDDAEFRLDPADDANSTATEELQITFVSALTAAALSLGHTGDFDYAWSSFGDGVASGKFSNAMRK